MAWLLDGRKIKYIHVASTSPLVLYISYIELKELKIFFTKIRPTLLLTKVLLVRPRGLTKMGGDPFSGRRKVFLSKF